MVIIIVIHSRKRVCTVPMMTNCLFADKSNHGALISLAEVQVLDNAMMINDLRVSAILKRPLFRICMLSGG